MFESRFDSEGFRFGRIPHELCHRAAFQKLFLALKIVDSVVLRSARDNEPGLSIIQSHMERSSIERDKGLALLIPLTSLKRNSVEFASDFKGQRVERC